MPRKKKYNFPIVSVFEIIGVIGSIIGTIWCSFLWAKACGTLAINEIKKNNLYEKLWQTFAVLTNIQTVGVMGDKRTYSYVVALRCVESIDAMTADWAELPAELLKTLSTRIVNEVPKVNRVVYDITSKPPGTIEWE